MIPEAELRETDHGRVPTGDGWFVLNAREARWLHSEQLGSICTFEGDDGARFQQVGINVNVLPPGEPMSMYHGEDMQENFLVVAGECVVVIEGEERRLRAWDFVHCPPWTKHVFIGAGERPCVLIGVGARPATDVVYPPDPVAERYDAAAPEETRSPSEAYARFTRPAEGRHRDTLLPDAVG